MTTVITFIIVCFVFLFGVMLAVFKRPKSIIEFLKTEKGATKGIILVIVFVFTFAIIGEVSAREFYVFVGLDRTKDISPQCELGQYDEFITSNVGVGMNLYESDDGKFISNAHVIHHSCAFNKDREGYDAVGVQFIYKVDLF